MLTLAAVIAVLSILIFVHELGHLLAAKAVDIEVPRFSIGFGPRVAGFRIGETEYVLSALPLGGYVKMAGMEDDEALEVLEGKVDAEREPSTRDFDSKPLWARALVIVAGVTMNFLLAILIYAGLAFFSGEQLDPTTRVAVTEPEQLTGAAAPLAEIPFGARLEAIGDRPVESWNDVRRSLFEAPPGPTVFRFADAPPVTLTLPPRDSARIPVIEALQPLHEPVIGRVEPGYPAAEVGLQPGDRVIAAGGQPIRVWSEMVRIISAHPGQPLPLEIERGGQRISLTVTPRPVADLNEAGERVSIGRLGVAPDIQVIHRTYGPGGSLLYGVERTWGFSTLILSFLGGLVTGDESPRNLGGPIAIGQLSGQAARLGLEPFLSFLAIFSINLAILNLLPIPILDGGQLLFLGVEAVRGRPLSVEQRLRLSHLGLIIVVGIMVWAMTNDVLRVFGI